MSSQSGVYIETYAFMLRFIAFICMVLYAGNVSAQVHTTHTQFSLRFSEFADRLEMNKTDARWQSGAVHRMPSSAMVWSRTVLSTLVGTSLGIAIGYGIDSDIQDSWIGVTDGMLIGGVVGSTVGAPLGAFLTNRRKGNVLLALGAAALTSVAAVYLAETDPIVAVIGLPIAHVGLSVVIIRVTE